jgi:iron(III) transport system substrate-binding protein
VRRLSLALAIVSLASALAGCGGDAARLTVYSGRTENLIGPLLEQFHEETGVRVDVRYGDSADLALLIEQEGGRTPADVFISQSPGALGFLAGADMLDELPAEVIDATESRFRSSRNVWVGLSGRVRTLVYNTELVDEADLPQSIFELTEAEYAGDVALAPSNGSFQDFVTSLRSEEGDDAALAWLEGMEANGSPTYANNTAILEAVARGEVPMGLVNHYYNERHLAEDPDSPTANHFFADGDLGSLLLTTGVGVVRDADEADDAVSLVRFLLGEDAQRFFSKETFEYPLAAGVEPAAALPTLTDVVTATVDLNDLGGGLRRTQELIASSGLEG